MASLLQINLIILPRLIN
uniref:Uncharacterized protein n=1 Tax=Arundo donax TaxID=35708 RepID=A0A0A9A5T0_ARUDO